MYCQLQSHSFVFLSLFEVLLCSMFEEWHFLSTSPSKLRIKEIIAFKGNESLVMNVQIVVSIES